MSVRVTLHQFRNQLSELLDRAVQNGEECIIQRDGQDYAVIVSAREWERRALGDQRAASPSTTADEEESRSQEIGRRLDALGPDYRVSPDQQERMEVLLAKQEMTALTPEERRELEQLVVAADQIMLRRAEAIRQVL